MGSLDTQNGRVKLKATVLRAQRMHMRGKPVVKASLRDDVGLLLAVWHDDGSHDDIEAGSRFILSGGIQTLHGQRVMFDPAYKAVSEVSPKRSKKLVINKKKPRLKKRLMMAGTAVAVLAVTANAYPSAGGGASSTVKDLTTKAAAEIQGGAQSAKEQATKQGQSDSDDCDIEEVPFATTIHNDPSLPEGETKLQPKGVKGKDRVCYEHGRDQAPTVTHISEPVDEVQVVGTYIAPSSSGSSSGATADAGCSDGYINTDGNCIPSPSADGGVRNGYSPTFKCRDGTASYAQHSRGACSHHGGISR